MELNLITHNELLKSGVVPWKSKKTTHRMIKSESFPHYKARGRLYFNREQIVKWWKKRSVIEIAK
jgi:hypothetical protein